MLGRSEILSDSGERSSAHKVDDDHLRKLTKNVSNATVELRGFLAQTTIRVSDLLSLQVGDVITTEKDSANDVLIQIEGKNKFLGQVGQFRGGRAIQITRRCQQLTDQPPIDSPGRNK